MRRWTGLPWQAQMLVLAAIWGTSFMLIKVADRSLSPYQLTAARILIGAATLLAMLAIERRSLPRRGRTWMHLAVVGLLNSVIPWTLFAYGETLSTSVLAGIFNATTPLSTMVLAMLTLPDERATRERTAGLVLGFGGVIVLLAPWHGFGSSALLGNLAFLVAALCYGLGFPYSKRFLAGLPESAVAISAGQLIVAAVELAILLPFVWTPIHPRADSLAAVAALGAFGTGIAYAINFGIVRRAGATAASTVTYLIPIFATAMGVLFLGERLTWNIPVGAAVVLLAVAITQGAIRLRPRRAAEELSPAA